MREIKFRYRYTDGKNWIMKVFTLSEIANGDPFELLSDQPLFKHYKHDGEDQYTGVKDKSSAEIYEGDVYHQGDPNITYTVVWHDTGLIGKQNGSSSYAGLEHWRDRIEVIGNIYEHPHLLTPTT